MFGSSRCLTLGVSCRPLHTSPPFPSSTGRRIHFPALSPGSSRPTEGSRPTKDSWRRCGPFVQHVLVSTGLDLERVRPPYVWEVYIDTLVYLSEWCDSSPPPPFPGLLVIRFRTTRFKLVQFLRTPCRPPRRVSGGSRVTQVTPPSDHSGHRLSVVSFELYSCFRSLE